MDKWTKAIDRAYKNVDKYLTTLWISCVKLTASPAFVEKMKLVISYNVFIHKKLSKLSTYFITDRLQASP